MTDVAFKYRKKKNGRGQSVDVLRLVNHSAKSAQRKVKKFTSHTVACKLRRISGGSVSLVRSGLNVRLLKRPIQIPFN